MPNLPRARARGSARSENSSGEQSGVASRAITPWTRDGPPIAAHNMLWVLGPITAITPITCYGLLCPESHNTITITVRSDSEIRLGDWQTFQKFGAAGARCVPTMVGRAAKKILRSRQPFLIGKWPLLGAIPLVGAQRSSQAGPAAFPSTYTFRMEAQTQRTAQGSDQVQVDLYHKVGRQCQNRGTENGV